MKAIKTFFLFSIVSFSVAFAGGKDKVVPFHVSYDVSFESDSPEMAQALPFMAGSSMEVMKNAKYSKTIFKTGSFGTNTTTISNKTKKGIAVTESMMGNFYTDVDELKDQQGEEAEVDIVKTDETEEILGYKCTKYVIAGDEGDIEIWTTTDLKGEYDSQFTPKSGKMEGFPLKMVIESEQMTITFLANDYKDKVPSDAEFSIKPPKGYEKKSAEEMMNFGM